MDFRNFCTKINFCSEVSLFVFESQDLWTREYLLEKESIGAEPQLSSFSVQCRLCSGFSSCQVTVQRWVLGTLGKETSAASTYSKTKLNSF